MKYKAILTFEFNTDEYYEVGPDYESARNLVKDMLIGDADMPQDIQIKIENIDEIKI